MNHNPHCLGNLEVIRWNFIMSLKYLLYAGVLSRVLKSSVFQEVLKCLGDIATVLKYR